MRGHHCPSEPHRSLLPVCAPGGWAPAATRSAVVQLPNPRVSWSWIPGQKEAILGRMKSQGLLTLRDVNHWADEPLLPRPKQNQGYNGIPNNGQAELGFSLSVLLTSWGRLGMVPLEPPVNPNLQGW